MRISHALGSAAASLVSVLLAASAEATIRNGLVATEITSPDRRGGCMLVVAGNVSIDHSVIETCTAPKGSGSFADGGGIHFNTSGQYSISWSTIRSNTAGDSGGGISSVNGSL